MASKTVSIFTCLKGSGWLSEIDDGQQKVASCIKSVKNREFLAARGDTNGFLSQTAFNRILNS